MKRAQVSLQHEKAIREPATPATEGPTGPETAFSGRVAYLQMEEEAAYLGFLQSTGKLRAI